MSEGTRDHFESPIEDVLNDLPLEDPPADLRDRCLESVKEAAAAHRPEPKSPPVWPLVWKGALIGVDEGLLREIGGRFGVGGQP